MKYPLKNIKKHRIYTTKEAAKLLGVHFVTVQEWIYKRGLQPMEPGSNPLYIHGQVLFDFLTAKTKKEKYPLQPDEFFCTGSCHRQRKGKPDQIWFIYTDIRIGKGNKFKKYKKGICEICGGTLTRFYVYEKQGAIEDYPLLADTS